MFHAKPPSALNDPPRPDLGSGLFFYLNQHRIVRRDRHAVVDDVLHFIQHIIGSGHPGLVVADAGQKLAGSRHHRRMAVRAGQRSRLLVKQAFGLVGAAASRPPVQRKPGVVDVGDPCGS